MKQKIIVIINSLGSGGTESYLCKILPELLTSSNVVVITLFDEKDYYELPSGCSRLKLNLKKRPYSGIRQIINYIENYDPKVILTWLTISNFLGLMITLMRKRTVICNIRQSTVFLNHSSALSNVLAYINLLMYGQAKLVIFNSEVGRKSHRFIYLPRYHSEVVQNGIPEALTKPIKAISEKLINREVINLGFVARNNKIKNFDMFKEVYFSLSSKILVSALVFGDGYEEDDAFTKKADTKKICFKGFIEDKHQIYNAIDILIVTSKSEGMPNNVLEALSAGSWVVCYPVGGLNELHHPRLIKVKNYDTQSYVNTIVDITGKKSPIEITDKNTSDKTLINKYISLIC